MILSLSKTSTNIAEKIDGNQYFDGFSKNNKWGSLNILSLSISSIKGEETILENRESIEKYGENKITISDNYFLVNKAEREKAIVSIWNRLINFDNVDSSISFNVIDLGITCNVFI